MPPPKYPLGLLVVLIDCCETVLIDWGYIVGMELNPKDTFIPGWWYAVKFTDGPSKGFQEWTPEDGFLPMSL